MSAHGSTVARARRPRPRAKLRASRVRLAAAAAVLVACALALGLVFAGSPGRLPEGVRIAGVDVGGLAPAQAVRRLEARSERLSSVPVTFVVGRERWEIAPRTLGVTVDWKQAVEEAARRGEGFAILRGYRRLALRLSPVDIEPRVSAYDAAVAYEVGRLADAFDRPHREARLVRHGLSFEIVPGRDGRVVDRDAASELVVQALAGFERRPVELPVRVDRPQITVGQLRRLRALAERAVSGPVTLKVGGAATREIPPAKIAAMLQLPESPRGRLALGGPAATAYFSRLDRAVSTPPRDAGFEVDGEHVTIVPSHPGTVLDVPRTAAAVLRAATGDGPRVATAAVARVQADRTTAEAKAMGITGLVGSYETEYGGVPNRIHNVQLVARLVDGTLIPPGSTFSFNDTTGERTAEKGFLEAPVIINGELQTGLGGGVCQVSTTVFNAAYEAGLPIVSRTNHALYISHYPLGRDATVDYPGIDLKFSNDTGHWLLLRTFVGPSSLVVRLYGTPQGRRVVSEVEPLRVVAPPPVVRKVDKTLPPGETEVESEGVPAQSTSVRRRVYDADGSLLSDATWYSSYSAEPRVVRVGPKRKPGKKAGKADKAGKPKAADGPVRPAPPASRRS